MTSIQATRYNFPNSKYFVVGSINANGYELQRFNKFDEKGRPVSAFCGHFGTIDGLLEAAAKYLIQEREQKDPNKEKTVEDLVAEKQAVTNYLNHLRSELEGTNVVKKTRKKNR